MNQHIQRWTDYVKRTAARTVWDRVNSLDAPPKRFLPGKAARPNGNRTLLNELLLTLVAFIDAGGPESPAEAKNHAATAEVLLCFFPRLLLPRGRTVTEALNDLVEGLHHRPSNSHRAERTSVEVRWADKITEAIDFADWRRATRLLDRGPVEGSAIPHAADWLVGGDDGRRPDGGTPFFPTPEDATTEAPIEERMTQIAKQYRKPITTRELLSWARTHTGTHPGSTGWSGMLIIQLNTTKDVTKHIARLWSRNPTEYRDRDVASYVYRRCDGWLIPQEGKKPRPIAAPQVPRRIRIASLMKHARPAIQNYCEPQGQLGPSGDGAKLAYSLIPLLTVLSGGTTMASDREASYQSFSREALTRTLVSLVDHAANNDRVEAAAALATAGALVHLAGKAAYTHVTFDTLQLRLPVGSLAQGCTLSPVLEAGTLIRRNPHVRGVLQFGAHDDLQTSFAGNVDVRHVTLPNTADVGGTYNTAKSTAVGVAADDLVRCGLASQAAAHSTVWGRPVGNIRQWYLVDWQPRFVARITSISRLAAYSRDTAIRAAMSLKGPATMARHWMRATPATELSKISELMKATDTAWLDLMLELIGLENATDQQRRTARAAVYGPLLGHVSMEDVAEYTSTTGMLCALQPLCTMAKAAGVDAVEAWGAILTGKPINDLASLTTSLHEQRDRAERAMKERQERYCATLARGEPARSESNAYADALKRPASKAEWPEAIGLPHGTGKSVLAYALCRAMQAPVWGILGRRPLRCALCGAQAMNTEVRQPTKNVDPYGEHAHACRGMPPRVSSSAKHNTIARNMAAIGRHCGVDAQYHSRPLWQESTGGRDAPADIIADGVSIDLTVRCGPYKRCLQAEREKECKYASHREVDHSFDFVPAAISTGGDVGPVWRTHMNVWAARLVGKRSEEGTPAGQPHQEVKAAFGYAFTVGMSSQFFAWAEYCERKEKGMRLGDPELNLHSRVTGSNNRSGGNAHSPQELPELLERKNDGGPVARATAGAM